jgi:uncharacterized protein (DUF433 family)
MKRRSIVHTRPWRFWQGGTCQDRPGLGAAPNQGMELTGNSVRSSLAPALPSSSCPAFDIYLVVVSTRARKGWYTCPTPVTCNCGMETALCMPCKRLRNSCLPSPAQKKRKCCSGSPVISGRHFPALRVPRASVEGEPCIVRTRMPVWVLVQARRLGTSEADLLRSYPTLRAEDLANAWAYARAHQEEIEHQILANETA